MLGPNLSGASRQLPYEGEPLAKRFRFAEFNGTTSKLDRPAKASPVRRGGTPSGVTERFNCSAFGREKQFNVSIPRRRFVLLRGIVLYRKTQ